MSEAKIEKPVKPLGRRAYGSIGHLPNSRIGPGDHAVHEGQAFICYGVKKDRRRRIVVQEKLDGSNVAVALVDGKLIALQRRGYPCRTSPHEMHHWFADWVDVNTERFRYVLREGERLCGEWLAMAHGTRYWMPTNADPFVAFDIMTGKERLPFDAFNERVAGAFVIPHVASDSAIHPKILLESYPRLGMHGAIDPIEGFVYRVEMNDRVEFLAKYVRHDKVDGCYLPEVSGKEPIWNWRPIS